MTLSTPQHSDSHPCTRPRSWENNSEQISEKTRNSICQALPQEPSCNIPKTCLRAHANRFCRSIPDEICVNDSHCFCPEKLSHLVILSYLNVSQRTQNINTITNHITSTDAHPHPHVGKDKVLRTPMWDRDNDRRPSIRGFAQSSE